MFAGMRENTTVYLFRHGETEWNSAGRRQGHLDSPLTQQGRLQAKGNARRLRQKCSLVGKVSIFASPLGRAEATARILVSELKLSETSISLEPRLMECSFGVWEGLTDREIKSQYPEEWQARSSDKWSIPAPSGESYADVHERVFEWVSEVSFTETNLIVCHGLTSRVIRGILADYSQERVIELDEPQSGLFKIRKGTEVLIL